MGKVKWVKLQSSFYVLPWTQIIKLFFEGIKKLLMKPENYCGHNICNTTKNGANPVVQIFRKAYVKDFANALKIIICKLVLKY